MPYFPLIQSGLRIHGLPAEVLKAVARSHPELLLTMHNSCLKAGFFHSRRKVGGLC